MEHEELHQQVDNLHPERNTEGLAPKRNSRRSVPERTTEGLVPKQNTRESIPERTTGDVIPERNSRGSIPERTTESGSGTSSVIILTKLQARFGLGNTSLAGEMTIEKVCNALDDENWQVRTAAVRRLGEIGDQTEVALLVSRLTGDEVPEVRAAAARALSSIRGTIPEEPLIAALEEDDDNVREASALALGSRGTRLSQQAIDALEDTFYGEPDENTRATIVTALGQAGKRASLEMLEVGLCDSDWQVREAATLAMGRQKARANIAALEVMLNDSVQPVRDAATHALKQIVAETPPTNKPRPTKREKPSTNL